MANYSQLSSANPGDQFTAAEMYNLLAANDEYNRNPPQAQYALATGASNITTSSAVMVDLTGYSVSFTTQANPGGLVQVKMELFGRATTVNARFDFLMDGVSISGDNDGLGAPPATGFVAISRIIAVSVGAHTAKVQWRSTSGTVTWYAAGLGQLYVVQV